MKASTLLAIAVGVIAIFGAFLWEGGNVGILFQGPAMLIVFGGTFAAGVAGTSLRQLFLVPGILKIAFFPPKYDVERIINQIVQFAGLARREGILAIESHFDKVEHPYLVKFFEVCIDGGDTDALNQIYESEITHISERHHSNISFFSKLGGYSPTMGIIGTVMGLISTLASVGADPGSLIQHIATAFIATMWGIFLANIVFLPISEKLENLHAEEMQIMMVILEGVKGVHLGETPSVIQSRLISYFPLPVQRGIKKIKSFDKTTKFEDTKNQNK